MKQRSDKMRELYEREGGRRDFVAATLEKRQVCEAGEKIGAHLLDQMLEKHGAPPSTPTPPSARTRWVRCTYRTTDVNELLMRSGTGSKTREANLLSDDAVNAVCRNCHDWIGNNSKAAIALGLKRSKHAGRNPEATT